MNRQDRKAWEYVAVVGGVSLTVGILALHTASGLASHWLPLVLLACMSWVTNSYPIRIPWTRNLITPAVLPLTVASTFLGPGAGFLIGVVSAMSMRHIRQRKYRALLFNSALYGMIGAIQGFLYRPVSSEIGVISHVFGLAVGFIVVAVVTAATNAFVLGGYSSTLHESTLWGEMRPLVHQGAWMVVGIVLQLPVVWALWKLLGVGGILLLVLPVVGLRLLLVRGEEEQRHFLGAVHSLEHALGAKDLATLEHCRRVGRYAADIGRQMHLSQAEVELLYYNGLLHDVGKIGIQDSILLKPGLFTKEEYRIMQKHAELGGQMTDSFWVPSAGVNAVSYHHERWDGRGYPRGLRGEQIPLAGRILAVADAFDAMTADRPYHRGIPEKAACEELIRCAGSQFDPSVVRAFLLSRGHEIPPDYDQRVRRQEQLSLSQDWVGRSWACGSPQEEPV